MGLTEPSTKFEICDWKSKDPNSFLQRMHTVRPLKDDVRVEYRSLMIQEGLIHLIVNPSITEEFYLILKTTLLILTYILTDYLEGLLNG